MALLERSNRSELPIRKTFLQQGAGKVRIPGPVATLIRNHDERALDLYLLVHAVCSAGDFDITLPAGAWARAIGLGNTASGRSTVSKAFRRLEELRLLTRARDGSRAKVTLLDESGQVDDSGNLLPYVHPGSLKHQYLKLPHSYWEESWHLRLDLRAKAVLLIALSLDDGFTLPIERAPDWYGISADTANRGLQDLRTHGLLELDISTKKAPLAPDGLTQVYRYTLKAPFGPLRKPVATVTKLKTKKATG
jgi:hypothetical protein